MKISVTVAYALPTKQVEIPIVVTQGCTALEAIHLSMILQQFSNIDVAQLTVGIYGQQVPLTTLLTDQDRVEIYRPLLVDPKQARRLRHKEFLSSPFSHSVGEGLGDEGV